MHESFLMSIEKFVDYTQILNKDYRILLFDIKTSIPTPLQWKFFINEFNENIRVLQNLECKFAFIFDAKLLGIISTEYILEFINLLKSNTDLLESKLISTSVIYEGVLINKLFEIIKLFYKTKKPLDFFPDMRKAIDFIDSNN